MPKTPFIDPLTGLQSPQNRNVKKPPLSEDLALSSGVLSYGPQDVGGYFETDSQFDKYIQRPDLPNLERERALMQPWHHQAFNATVGGIASGLLTAVEVTANIGDLENHLERMGGFAHVEQNAIASYMQDSKEELAKKLPIYRESSDIIDWRDSGFYWSAVKGIIDSAVGFAIPGMGASKAVGAVQKLARISSYLNFLKTSQATSQIINSLASGYLTNLGEGMVMGVEQYENSINQLKENLLQSNITAIKDMNPDMPLYDIFQLAEQQTQQQLAEGKEKEFSEIAGEEADRFLSRNRIFMLTDAIGLHGIYKGQGFTRALIKEKGFGAAAKRLTKLSSDNLILQGFKESAEEIGQNVLQMEGEYQSRKTAGMDVSDDPEDVLSRAYKFATSEQALLEGMMGFFGGGPQRILTEAVSGNLSASAKARQAQRYQDQQSQIAENTAFLNKKLAYYTKAQAERMAAIKAGETDVADFIAKNEFVHLATENFVHGTTENLERQLQDIANGVSEQERIANGWDENYQQQAKDQLELLDKLETSYNRYSKYENQANVFANRQTRRLLQEDKERIQSLLDDVDMELSSQEEGSKDPDLLGRKKYLEKGLTDATRLINEKDVEFKDLTSAKTQKAVVDQKKKIIKDAKEISKKIEARRKKEDQERKAKERREKNETKNKAKREQEQEKEKTNKVEEKKKPADDVDLDKVTEQDELELSSLSDETDVTPDASQLDDVEEAAEPDLSDMDADEAQAYEEKKQSQKEFDDLSDSLLNGLEQLATNEILIEGEDISDTQRNVGILEMMIQAAQKATGKENITFDDVVDMLLKRHGSKRIAPLFNMIQGIYTQIKPMTNLYRNFEDYVELSETDKKELGDKKQQAKAITKEQFTEGSIKELDEDIEQLEKDFSKTDEETEFDYVRVLQGHNVLAYLSRLYTQTKNLFSLKRTDVDNKINEEIQDRDILDPKKYKVGTEVSFIVEDDNETKVYVDSSSRKEKIRTTWGAKKASYQSNVVEGETERYNELYEEEVPIAVYINGKKVGYLHETSWINETNVSGDIETDRAMSKKIRKHIVEKGSYNTTISKRSNGYLWKVANNELMTTDEALPDPNMTIAVVKNGKLHENRNKPVSGIKLVNKTLKEGVSYAIVPISSTEHIALPLINKKLSESPEIASTIRRALEIFYSEDKSKEAEAFVDEIIKATQNTAEGKSGYNIRTAIGLSQYINMFIHLTDTADTIAGKDPVTGKPKGTLQTFLEENTTNDQTNDGFATSYVREGNDLQFEVARGRGVGSRTMSKASYAKLTNDAKTKLFNEIEAVLNRMYINISLDSIGDSSRNVVIVNNDGSSETRSYNNHIRQMTKSAFMGHNIAEEGESPNYVYAVQPVITFDFSEFEDKNISETAEKKKPSVPVTTPESSVQKELDAYLDTVEYNSNALISVIQQSGRDKYTVIQALKDASEKDDKDNFGSIVQAVKVRTLSNLSLGEKRRIAKYDAALSALDEVKTTETKVKPKTQVKAATVSKGFVAIAGETIKKVSDSSMSGVTLFTTTELADGTMEVTFNPVDDVAKTDAGISPYKYMDKSFNEGGVEPFTAADKVITHRPAIYKKVGDKWVLQKKGVIEVVGKTTQKNITSELNRYDGVVEQTQETKSTTSKKESPKYKKGRFDFSSTDEYLSNADPLSELVVPLGEEEIKEISDKAEVTEVGKRGITGVIISEFGSAFKQQQVTDFIRSEVVDRIFKKRRSSRKQAFIDVKQIIEEELAIAKENLKLATEENDAEGIEMFTRAVKEISIITNNWSKLEKMVSKQLERIENIKIIENEENEISEEEQEVMNEMSNYADASTFTTPSTNRLAQQIKQFLSGIRAYRQDPANKGKYVPDINYFGMQKTMDFMEVYNILQRITPNLEPSYEAIYEAIKQHAEVFPFLQDILAKLDNAPQFIKNQLVAGMTNHDVDMKFIQFEQNQNGSYKLTEFDADANAPQRVLLQDWYNASIDRIGEQSPDGDDILIPEEVSKNLYATWEKFSKSKTYTDDEITDWFYQIGVELTDKTWRDIRNGNFEYRGRKIAYKDFVETHVMKILAKVVSSKRARSLAMGGDRLIDENVIKALAKHDARYRANAISNSFRAGTKTVYSYSLNKFLINRMRQLKNGHFKALKRLSFNGNSFWADQFLDKESGFSDNFNRWTISLEALKRKSAKSRNHREFHNLSEGEMELVKIAMLQADRADLSGQNKRVINVFYLTTSDKTTAMGLTVLAQKLILSKTGEISNESIDTLIDAIVRPEINRITVFQKKQLAEKSNIKGYDKGGDQFLMLPEMNTLTWRDSNEQTQKMFNEDGSINGDLYSTEAIDAMRSAVREHFSNLLEEKLEMWRQNGIGQPSKDKDGKVKKGTFAYLHSNFLDGTSAKESNPMGIVESEHKVKAAATDMIFQYLIANAEMHKAFNGDPALYYKQAEVNIGKSKTDPEYDFVADSRDTYDNINKRLAADIAPGTEVAIGTNDIYTQLILKDSPSESLARFEITAILDGQEKADKIRAIYKDYQEGKIGEQEYKSRIKSEVKGTISSNYYSFDGTDAQEYTTWKEHLYILKQLGKISNEEYDNAYATLSKKDGENDLGKELLDKVMQPMKPVFVDNIIDESSDVEKRVYIKSSAFPLLPQLTRGLEIDKLRRMMESKNIDRAAFTTAIKVGGPSKAVNIWNSDGTINDDVDITGSTLSLTRSKGFRIQQEVPYDPAKSTITKVSQASKNLLINMLDVEDFMIGDKRYNGRALQQIYHETYGRLHEIEKQKLEKRIGYDPVKGIYGNIQTLREILIEEARERNYPLSDQELMELDKELRFLAFSPSANKYESLLNSLVTNRIIRLKMHGKSYVLGSEEGFKALISDEAEVAEKIAKTPGIVFTDKWTGKLLPARKGPNGERLPSQAIVPWKFKNKDGEYLDIRQYMVGNKLDMSKIPEEMLQMFGMRIPNQGPNSQAWIEIVGFLPEAQGDLIITTRDFVVQMGSDFDVDKLYTYTYSYYIDNDGVVRPHRELKSKNEEDILRNTILDVHLAIHRNPDNRVQSQIVNPLGTWELKDIADEVSKLRKTREEQGGKKKQFFTGLSDSYQRRKFKEGTAGKSGVGVFSLDSMFNAVVQGKNLVFKVSSKDNLKLTIGNRTSDGNLSEETSLDGKTYKSDVIAGYQSAAVDNAKDPLLDKLNINSYTFKVIKILNQLGFTHEVPYLLSQDIVIEYVSELERLSSSMSDFYGNREDEAYRRVVERYNFEEYNFKTDSKYAEEEATIENLKKYIELGPSAPNYNKAQIAILNLFRKLDEYGLKIQTLQSTINPDSAGIGKSVLESQLKEEQVYKLINETGEHISNASSLIGEIKMIQKDEVEEYSKNKYHIRRYEGQLYAVKANTINGHAIVHGLFAANDMWSHLFPYRTSAVDRIFTKVEQLTGRSANRIPDRADRRKTIWNNMKSYLFTKRELGLYESNINLERERLLYDRWKKETVTEHGVTMDREVNVKESLGTFLSRVKRTPLGMNNGLLNKLSVDLSVSKAGKPTLIKYNASVAESVDESNVYVAFIDMFTKVDPKTGNSPVVGTWNGREVTLRELAQELVLYSYITGGIQEAVQFVKYIPASYLTTIPFANELGSTHFTDIEFGIERHTNPIIDYYQNLPPFVQQYIQHNPDQVPVVAMEDIERSTGNGTNTVTSFSLKPDTIDRIGERIVIENTEQMFTPVYVSIKNGKSEKGYRLFKYDYANHTYKEIDVLGSFANDEYNANTPYQRTLVRNNKAKEIIPKKSESVITQFDTEELQKETGNPLGTLVDDDMDLGTSLDSLGLDLFKRIDSLIEGTLKPNKYDNGKEEIKKILNEIINTSTNAYYAGLAQELLSKIDILPTDVSVSYVKSNLKFAGRYASFTSVAQNAIAHTIEFNIHEFKDKSPDYLAKVMLHEITHAFTIYKAKYYEALMNNDEGLIKDLRSSSPKLGLSKKEEEIMKSISVLRNHAFNAIVNTPEIKERFDQLLDKLNHKRDPNVKFGKNEINKLYGLTSLGEFITMATSSPEFMEILNGITAPDQKTTVLEKIRQKLTELLNSILGFDVKEGHVFAETLRNVLELNDAITESGLANEIIEGMQEKAEGVKRETKVFKEHGTYYRFELEKGVPVKGEYSQGNTNNWKDLNVKTMTTKYSQLLEDSKKPKKEETPKELPEKVIVTDNQLELYDGTVITFNEQQVEALESMRDFLKSDDGYFVLTGFAGTGKSTIVKKLIEENNQIPFRDRKRIGGSAPTHRAKRVLKVLTGQDAVTIHSLLGLSLNTDLENFSFTTPVFDPKNPPLIGNYDIIIIDESSMINKNLYGYIKKIASNAGTKIIFMGDPGQIPPVGEKASKVFTDPDVKRRAHLTKVERVSGGNPLTVIYDAIRENLTSAKDQFTHETKINEKGEGIFFTANGREFERKMMDVFSSDEYKNDPTIAKAIAWTTTSNTSRVQQLNYLIRTNILGDNVDIVEVGDVLTGYSTINKEYKGDSLIENSADYVVVEKSNRIKNNDGIYGYDVTVKDLYGDENTPLETFFFVDTKDKQNVINLKEQAKKLLDYAKAQPLRSSQRGRGFAAYGRFQRENIVNIKISEVNKFGKEEVILPKAIDYGYAVSAHKSQGGTFKYVFVDENDIDKNRTIQERNQIKYVSLSRASHSATVLSAKTTVEKNSYSKPVNKTITSPDPNIDLSKLQDIDVDVNQMGDQDVEGISFLPNEDQVKEFMKKCKS